MLANPVIPHITEELDARLWQALYPKYPYIECSGFDRLFLLMQAQRNGWQINELISQTRQRLHNLASVLRRLPTCMAGEGSHFGH